MEYIFEIKNLDCSYNQRDVVLHIEELKIPEKKIVFFVGPSGIGKSTILETLGFMNNTIFHVDMLQYKGSEKYNGKELKYAWSWKDNQISNFRNNEFSFIFQQTNLMPNFTAYENVITTMLFQGEDTSSAFVKAREVLKKMGLPYKEDKPVFQYSGGQQQRIAFARAILPKFSVLFGDEPTGNLDPKSAENLMSILSAELRERDASAIIVSHDMHLAVEYADVIILIKSDGEKGIINSNSVFIRDKDEWHLNTATYSKTELQNELLNQI